MALDELILKYVGGHLQTHLPIYYSRITLTNRPNTQNRPNTHYYDFNSFKSLIDTNKNKFSILSSNMQSLHAKFSELLAFVIDLQSAQFNFCIICIQESWLNENDDISQIELENYTCVTQGKSSSTKGGLVMYINNNFNFKINKLSIRNHNWEAQVITLSGGGLSLEKY